MFPCPWDDLVLCLHREDQPGYFCPHSCPWLIAISHNYCPWLLCHSWAASSRGCLPCTCDTPPQAQLPDSPHRLKCCAQAVRVLQVLENTECPVAALTGFWSAVHSGCYEVQYKHTRMSEFSWNVFFSWARRAILSTCSDATEIIQSCA